MARLCCLMSFLISSLDKRGGVADLRGFKSFSTLREQKDLLSRLQRDPGRREPGHGNSIRGSRDVVEAGSVTGVDRPRIAAVLAADPHLEIGVRRPAELNR